MAARKILIVFYSRSGTTRMVAEALAAELKCDAEEIFATKSRAGFVGIMRSLIEAMRRSPAQIATARFNPLSYDLIVIGTPVWAWSVSSPIRGYMIDNNKNFPQVAFFFARCNTAATGPHLRKCKISPARYRARKSPSGQRTSSPDASDQGLRNSYEL